MKDVYVVGFVPCTTTPKDVREAFDPFLEPLMNDLADGFRVPYPSDLNISNFDLGKMPTIRVLLLCWTTDHSGQCEFGKFLNQGK